MIAAVWWYYNGQKRETEAATARELFAVASATSNQVANWRGERIGDGRVLSASRAAPIAAKLLSDAEAHGDREELTALVSRMGHEFLYTGATLADLKGLKTVRLFGSPREDAGLVDLARAANGAKDVVLSDLLPAPGGRAVMELAIPVNNSGTLIIDIDPERFLYPYLRRWPGARQTAETFLVRIEGDSYVYLSRRRDAPAAALFSRRPLPRLPLQETLDAGWSTMATDFRGIRAMFAIRRVPDSTWYVVSKIDLAEVDGPINRLGWEMALVTALIVVVNITGAGLILRNRQLRIDHDKQAWFRAVANDTPACLWMAGAEDENTFINKTFAEFLGVRQSSLSKSWSEYLHPEDAPAARENLGRCLAERRGYIHEFRVRRFDGRYRWVVSQAVPRFSPAGGFLGFAGSLIDITERKLAEEQLRGLSKRLLNAQEEDRKRLARELHDDLNQQIAALSIGLENVKRRSSSGQTPAEIERLRQKLNQLSEAVRRISHELHPALLEYAGLGAALSASCEEFGGATGIEISLNIRGSLGDVPPDACLCIYRIFQEALQNIAKHSRASRAAVELEREAGTLRLTVSDSGVGMDTEKMDSVAGLGLISMRERVRLAGGALKIESEVNQGTRITAELPVEEAGG